MFWQKSGLFYVKYLSPDLQEWILENVCCHESSKLKTYFLHLFPYKYFLLKFFTILEQKYVSNKNKFTICLLLLYIFICWRWKLLIKSIDIGKLLNNIRLFLCNVDFLQFSLDPLCNLCQFVKSDYCCNKLLLHNKSSGRIYPVTTCLLSDPPLSWKLSHG